MHNMRCQFIAKRTGYRCKRYTSGTKHCSIHLDKDIGPISTESTLVTPQSIITEITSNVSAISASQIPNSISVDETVANPIEVVLDAASIPSSILETIHNPLATSVSSVHSESPCSICLEVAEDILLTCNHPLCLSCSDNLRTPSCPICRGPLAVKDGSKFLQSNLEVITNRHTEDRKQREEAATEARLHNERRAARSRDRDTARRALATSIKMQMDHTISLLTSGLLKRVLQQNDPISDEIRARLTLISEISSGLLYQ